MSEERVEQKIMSEAQITFYVNDKKNWNIFIDYFKFDQYKDKRQSFKIPKGGKFLKIHYYNGSNEESSRFKDCAVHAKILFFAYNADCKLLSSNVDSIDETKNYGECHMIDKRTRHIEIVYQPPAQGWN